ncbi:hypothetical protein [Microbacterium deminutum]|uniref:Uncharacterized protein n=1 Tax=Microbacterium deminutum TaxID=344164 RepID=A0ABP5CH64_9MICO
MPEALEHEEITARFVKSQSLNFDAIGKFVTEIGPELVERDAGLHGVIFGKFSTIACVLRADDVERFFGGGGMRGFAGLADALNVTNR